MQAQTNAVDGKNVPVRHFGAILEWKQWHKLADTLKAAGIAFIIEPYIRFQGEVGEQATMFFLDPVVMHWNLNLLRIHRRYLRLRQCVLKLGNGHGMQSEPRFTIREPLTKSTPKNKPLSL